MCTGVDVWWRLPLCVTIFVGRWKPHNPCVRQRQEALGNSHAPSCHVEGLAQRSEPASLAPDLFPLTLDCKLATKESYGCLCVFVTQRGEKKASCVSGVHDNPAHCVPKKRVSHLTARIKWQNIISYVGHFRWLRITWFNQEFRKKNKSVWKKWH